jgi:hypothetical protein
MDVTLPGALTIPSEVWYILLILGLGLLVSVVTEFIKKWLVTLGDKRITAILTFLSGIAGFIETAVAQLQANPLILGQNTALIIGVSTLAYRFIVKPAVNLINDAKLLRESQDGLDDITSPTTDDSVVDELPEEVVAPEKRPVGQYADF